MPKFFKKNCFFGLERWLSEGKVQEDWISTARTHVDKWCCRAGAIPVLLQKNRRWKQEKLWSTWARTPGRCRKKKTNLETQRLSPNKQKEGPTPKAILCSPYAHYSTHVLVFILTHPKPRGFSLFLFETFSHRVEWWSHTSEYLVPS